MVIAKSSAFGGIRNRKIEQEGGAEETEKQFIPLPDCKKQRGSAGTHILSYPDQQQL